MAPEPSKADGERMVRWLRRHALKHGETPPGARELEIGVEPSRLRRAAKMIGPGFIAGSSDDDPTAIASYASAGAAFGYATAWTALVTYPMMAVTVYLSSKLALCSGQGLAGTIKTHYPRGVLYPVVLALVVTNTINAGADIGAIAAGLNLIAPVPIAWLIVPVAIAILAMQVWGSFKLVERVFKWLALMLMAYVGAAFLARPDWASVLHGTLVPDIRFDGKYLATLVAILGGNLSPYLFFWQASEEIEGRKAIGERRLWQRRGVSNRELGYAAWDVNIGMAFSNIVIWAINVSTAATLFYAGHHDINSAAEAASALRPLAGNWAYGLFAVGIIGSGFLAVPVLTGTSAFALSETFGWKSGLDETPHRAPQFYAIIVASTLVGMGINFLGINPIAALFWSAVLNGLIAPPLLVLIMQVTNNPKIMGDRRNGPLLNLLGWATTAVMFLAAIGLLLTWGKG